MLGKVADIVVHDHASCSSVLAAGLTSDLRPGIDCVLSIKRSRNGADKMFCQRKISVAALSPSKDQK